ncbi:hypothetical protein G7046_g7943 [Stylonectria norvegica]|nr:hypothetical protein G7046_g7943 [Stylonectria norvegica]
MQFTLIAALLATAVVAVPNELLQGRTGCGSDNCGRAVNAGRLGPDGLAAHFADCDAFFEKTVTPSAVTVYVTKSVPTYASACSGTARYLTACACVSHTGVVVEAPTPTVTLTTII